MGSFGDSALASFCNQRAFYGQSLDDDEINEFGARLYNELNGLDPNVIDLTGSSKLSAKLCLSSKYAKQLRTRYPRPSRRKPQLLTRVKKRSAAAIAQAQKHLSNELEKIGFKHRNGNIKQEKLGRVGTFDEVGGKTKNKPKKVTTFQVEDKQIIPVKDKPADTEHVSLLMLNFLDGCFLELKPLTVIPRKKHVPQYLVDAIDQEWKGSFFGANQSGYIRFELFYDLFRQSHKLIVPRPSPLDPVVFIGVIL